MARDREHDRLVVSPGALLGLQRAVELIPVGTEKERRDWLQARGLVRYLFGRPVVRWADVLAELGPDPQPATVARPTEPRPKPPLTRVRL